MNVASTNATATVATPVAVHASIDTTGLAEKVSIRNLPASSSWCFIIADEKGYFRDENIEADVVPYDSGAKMIPQLSAGLQNNFLTLFNQRTSKRRNHQRRRGAAVSELAGHQGASFGHRSDDAASWSVGRRILFVGRRLGAGHRQGAIYHDAG